jgi:hypothetical protein
MAGRRQRGCSNSISEQYEEILCAKINKECEKRNSMLLVIVICIIFITLVAYLCISNNRLRKATDLRVAKAKSIVHEALLLSLKATKQTDIYDAIASVKVAQANIATAAILLGGSDMLTELIAVDVNKSQEMLTLQYKSLLKLTDLDDYPLSDAITNN